MIGKYGIMRRTYLEEYRPMEYARMLREGILKEHLEKVSNNGKMLLAQQMEALEKTNPAPDRRNQMDWVRHMNSLKQQAEEIVLNQIVYNDLT